MKRLFHVISITMLAVLALGSLGVNIAVASTPNMILLWDGASPPTDWTCISDDVGEDFYERFPRGEATYGTPGGSTTHTHTASLVACSAPSSTINVQSGGEQASQCTHTHALASSDVSPESNLPSYRDLKVIRYNGIPSVIPAGAIAIFDTSAPSGWTRYAAQDNYFVRGAGTVATGGSNDHAHNVDIDTGAPSATTSISFDTGTVIASHSHTHTGSDSSATAENQPPFLTVILAKADSDTAVPMGMIAMFDDTPGTSWNVLSGSGGDLYQRFIKGDSSYGTPGGSSSHSHTNLTITTGVPSDARLTVSGTTCASSSTHRHDITVSFSNENHLPPYRDVIFAKRINQAPPVPTLLSPANSSYSTSPTPTFDWTDVIDPDGDPVTYDLQVDNNGDFSSPEIDQTGLSSSTFTPGSNLDEGTHYWQVRSSDGTLPSAWSSAWSVGIDTVPPTDPTNVTSTSHTTSVWSNDNTVDVTWTDATDATSGLDGYSVLWDTSPATSPDQTKDIEDGIQATTSPALADGDSHYCHIASVDNAGNWQTTAHLGPFFIDTTPPTMQTIVEAEGQYYDTAPSFSNFGFNDTIALDDVWYQMDSFSGAWTAIFTDIVGTSINANGWTIPGFAALAEGTHTIYFSASDDIGNIEGEAGEWSWQFFKDTTPPTDPTNVTSTSHTTSVWSNDNTVDVTWTDATDATSGLDGYSVLWDTSPINSPDQIKDIEDGVQATTSPALADGDSHYFHIASVDNAGNWQTTAHLGPFFIDATPPTMESVAEAEGQYYDSAPSFSNFGFDDTIALDDGWYQMDSFAGAWTSIFSNATGTSWDANGWTIPGFYGMAEGTHTIYFSASDDTGNIEGEAGEWSWQFFKDTTPPTDPTNVTSTSHATSVWSNDNTVDVTWTDATDATSGLDGYSVLWDTSPATSPDQIKDIEDGVQATTSPALADGDSHYCHIASVDNAGNWQTTAHLGPFFIDTTLPNDPTNVTSTSHTTSVWSNDNTVDVTWTDATDANSGLDGYSVLWDTSPATSPNQIKDIEDGIQATTSPALADGDSHYCHIASVDNAGNWQTTAHLGPFFIDATQPDDPTDVTSTSHTTGVQSNDNTIDVTWTDATDANSGLDGYSVLWDTNPATSPDQTKDIEDGVQATTSPTLDDGDSHYFHIASVDNAGNWQTTVHLGPFIIDTTPPGGGGSGGALQGHNPLTSAIDPDGLVTTEIYAESFDHLCRLTLETGTTAKTKYGKPLCYISMQRISIQPPPPEGAHIIGLVYDFQPTGATFNPPITLTFSYDPSLIQEGILEENLTMAYYDYQAGEWLVLDSTVDTENNTITTKIGKFSTYTILGFNSKLATFSLSSLAISPKVADVGENLNISVLVSNSGDSTGSCELTLNIDEVTVATEEVTVAGNSSHQVSFTTSADAAGICAVDINGLLSDSFEVRAASAVFKISDLTISPSEVSAGESLTISMLVTNEGDLADSYEVTLKIGDDVIATRQVTLAGGASEKVSFAATRDIAGTYSVDANGLSGSFAVKAATNTGISGGLTGGIIAAVLALGLLGYFYIAKRRKA